MNIRKCALVSAAVFTCLAAYPQGVRAGDAARAKRDLANARDEADSQRWDSVNDMMKIFDQDMKGLSDAEKAPILKDLAAMKLASSKLLEEEVNKKIEKAAKEDAPFAAGDLDRAATRLDSDEAKNFMDPAVIEKLRKKIAGLKGGAAGPAPDASAPAKPAEETKPAMVTNPDHLDAIARAKRNLEAAKMRLDRDPDEVEPQLKNVENELTNLTAAEKAPIAAEVESVRHQAFIAKNAEHARPIELFVNEKIAFSDQAATQIDRSTAEGVLVEAEEKTNSADAAMYFEPEKLKELKQKIADARERSIAGQKTTVITRTSRGLKRLDDRLARNPYKGVDYAYEIDVTFNPALKAAQTDAEKTLGAAAAKVSAAYNQILEQAEKVATPPRDFNDQEGPSRIASITARELEGTKYKETTVARATALAAKWKAAIANAEKEKKELYAKLSAEASAAWPAIDASVKAQAGFDPSNPGAWQGKTIKLKAIRNRAGWDFDGNQYDFSMRVNGVAIAGNYDPKVAKACKDAMARAKQDIDDHKDWDVILVVVGQGTVKQRLKREVVVKETNEKFNLESWEPTPCVLVKVVGLHAGPVAVGPN